MRTFFLSSVITFTFIGLLSCSHNDSNQGGAKSRVQPHVITEPVLHDTDDPAIWINEVDPSQSLILGTDKGGDTEEGGLYVFRLDGSIDRERSVFPLNRPNNVDVAYKLAFQGSLIDVAVVTVRRENKIRIFRLPDMQATDNGGIPVFVDEQERDPMGVSLYSDYTSGRTFAIVGRKSGPKEGYLWQYEIKDGGKGYLVGEKVRVFGQYSAKKEIEAIAVDNELGYVYYSDEQFGVRKYYAHPDSSTEELALFAQSDVNRDHEGLSILKNADGTGYIIMSDQQGQRFHLYTREGSKENPHTHRLIKIVDVAATESDGSEVSSRSLGPLFPNGIFVAMSNDKTFHFYRLEELLK
jgi:3-phytase